MEIKEIYENIDKIAIRDLMVADKMMTYFQTLGLNGYKRIFRINAKELFKDHIELNNDLFDYFRLTMDTKVDTNITLPANIKNALEVVKNTLDSDLKELGNLNKEYYNATGIENCTVKDMIDCYKCYWNKVSRKLQIYNDVNWSMEYIHLDDNKIHEKYKKMEEENE